MKHIFYGLLTMMVFGCFTSVNAGPIKEWIANKNLKKTEKSSVLKDIAYGLHPKQKIDVYLPKNVNGNAPIMVMVHGGAWKMGDKARFNSVDSKVTRWVPKGFIVVSVNYRLLPKANPTTQASDVAQAMIYIQKHAKKWGGYAKKIILMGHSSGGHLVSLVAANPKHYPHLQPWLGTISLDTAALDVVTLMMEKRNRFYEDAFGKSKPYWIKASPYHQLSRNAKPLLLVCGEERANEPCKAAEAFAKKATSLGVKTKILPQALNHAQINAQLGQENAYTRSVEDFMRSLGLHF